MSCAEDPGSDPGQRLHHPTPYSSSTMRAFLAAVTMLQALITGTALLEQSPYDMELLIEQLNIESDYSMASGLKYKSEWIPTLPGGTSIDNFYKCVLEDIDKLERRNPKTSFKYKDNLTLREHLALKILSSDPEILIREADKDCLMCERCLATGTSQCSGIFKQCPPDVTHCIKGLENNTVGGYPILTAYKDCLDAAEQAACGREFSLQNTLMSYRVSRVCCDSNFCNTGDVEVPAVDETPNGYQCKDCYTDQALDACTVAGDVQCTGEHTTCAGFHGTASIP
ncbi:uncharacterized protein LOC144805484, partial [Lissotriton helveticus]